MHAFTLSVPVALLTAALALPVTATYQDAGDAEEIQEEELDAYELLEEELADARSEWMKVYRAAETDEDREALGSYPGEEFTDRFVALAREHAGTSIALRSLSWVTSNGSDDAVKAEALAAIERDHLGDEGVGEVAMSLSRDLKPGAGDFLRRVMSENTHHEAQGRACYALAKHLKGRSDLAARVQGDEATATTYRGYYGDATVDDLLQLDPEPGKTESVTLLERVVDEFSDVIHYRTKTIGESATGDLFELRSLQIGMVAPGIAGEDIDGVAFSTKDYLGKVVVLDFWGNW